MSCIEGVIAGAGLGLVYFQGLWLTVRWLACGKGQGARVSVGASNFARFLVAALVFFVLAQREGVGTLAAALAGFCLSRWCLIRELGGRSHDR